MGKIDLFLWQNINKIRKQQCIAFLSAIITGVVSHGYVFANKISYHDDTVLNGFGGTFPLGRWFLGFMEVCMNRVGGYLVFLGLTEYCQYYL